MTRSNLAVAADYADAMLVARFWKNLLFLALFLLLLIQIAVFFVVRFHTHTDAGVTQLAGTTQPAMLSGQDLTKELYWLINTTDFLAIIAVVVLAIVMLLIMGIMLVGRLVGVTHVTRAFIGSVVLMVVLFPWQSVWNYPAAGTLQTEPTAMEDAPTGPRFGLPGVLYTWPELQHHAHFRTDPITAAILGWARFVGWPVVAIIILLVVQARSSRGLKFALGEAEINVVETAPPPGRQEIERLMREERGHLAGNIQINEPYTLWGSIAGTVSVGKGGKFYMRGAIYGNLNVLRGGRVHVFGNVSGNLTLVETKVIHSGTLGGDALNQGGRLYIDSTAKVLGKVKTLEGETTIEPQARISGA